MLAGLLFVGNLRVLWLPPPDRGEGGGGGGVVDRRDVLDLMHGRSRMTVDPRMPGRSMSGFHWASSMQSMRTVLFIYWL